MPQFVVPQFIDVEDKIIGPITTRQFIMGVIVMLFMFVAYRFAKTSWFILDAILLLGFYILVAFIKVNGRPFYYFIINIIRSIQRPRLRLWSREATNWQKVPLSAAPVMAAAPIIRKKLVDQELSSLSLLVDTGGRYRPEEILQRQKQEINSNNQKK